jgi:hypothetical protein
MGYTQVSIYGVHHHALQSHPYEGDGQFVALHHIMLVHTAQLSGRGYGDGYIHWCHVFHIQCLYMQNDYTFKHLVGQPSNQCGN